MYKDIQLIGDLAKDGVFIYDLNASRFSYVNMRFADIFNISNEQLLQQPELVLPFIRSEDHYYLRHLLGILKKEYCITDAEFRMIINDNSVVHLSCDAYLVENDSAVICFVKNFTLEKEHEDYIVNYGAKKDTLLDMMTHNLSGPLNLSQNILRWMQENTGGKTGEDIGSQLHIIQDNIRHCLEIVNDFLKQEHLESERIYVKKTRFDLLEHLVATLDKLIAVNKNKHFRLVTELENLNINTDSVKFFQIIHNLVSNAIKFTPEDGQIDIIVEERKKTFIIRVRDNGIGIPSRFHASLFDKRTSASRNGLKNEMSTGLGLSIVKTLVGLLDGQISFQTEEGKGTTFSVELPKD